MSTCPKVAAWPDPVPLDFREGVGLHLTRSYAVPLSVGAWLTIPAGEATDLASIPRVLQVLSGVDPWELGIVAPVVHDYLYRRGGEPDPGACVPAHTFTREQADAEFLHLMERCEIGKAKRGWAHRLVRWFGAPHWRSR